MARFQIYGLGVPDAQARYYDDFVPTYIESDVLAHRRWQKSDALTIVFFLLRLGYWRTIMMSYLVRESPVLVTVVVTVNSNIMIAICHGTMTRSLAYRGGKPGLRFPPRIAPGRPLAVGLGPGCGIMASGASFSDFGCKS